MLTYFVIIFKIWNNRNVSVILCTYFILFIDLKF